MRRLATNRQNPPGLTSRRALHIQEITYVRNLTHPTESDRKMGEAMQRVLHVISLDMLVHLERCRHAQAGWEEMQLAACALAYRSCGFCHRCTTEILWLQNAATGGPIESLRDKQKATDLVKRAFRHECVIYSPRPPRHQLLPCELENTCRCPWRPRRDLN